MRLFPIILLSFGLAGCASTVVYNPMQVASQQEFLLNQSGFKALQNGMTETQVHKIMGDALVIGYQYQSADYKPLTIPNPYKTETLAGTPYFIEYYINAINQPDGVVHNDQLMPLVFKNGNLIGSGWNLVNYLRSNKSLG